MNPITLNAVSRVAEMELLLDRIVYPKMMPEMVTEGVNLFLRWVCPEGTCNVTGKEAPWKSRKWRLSVHMTDGEVVGTAFMALLQSLEHEARERFKFDGVPVYDAHVDIHKLVELHKTGEATLERVHSPSPAQPYTGKPQVAPEEIHTSHVIATGTCTRCNLGVIFSGDWLREPCVGTDT